MGKKIKILVIILLLGALGYSGYRVISLAVEYKEGERIYAEATESFVSVTEEAEKEEPEKVKAEAGETLSVPPESLSVDFAAIKEVNDDIVGWIYIPGTVVCYPLMQGEDNEHYLNYAYQGTYNSAGSIFVDYRNSDDFDDANTLIYGHNMDNGTQFAILKKYMNQEFFDQHPSFYIITEEGYLTYDIFSVQRVHTLSPVYQTDTKTEEGYAEFMEFATDSKGVDNKVEVTVLDKTVTLSTCTYGGINERFVIHGKLVENK